MLAGAGSVQGAARKRISGVVSSTTVQHVQQPSAAVTASAVQGVPSQLAWREIPDNMPVSLNKQHSIFHSDQSSLPSQQQEQLFNCQHVAPSAEHQKEQQSGTQQQSCISRASHSGQKAKQRQKHKQLHRAAARFASADLQKCTTWDALVAYLHLTHSKVQQAVQAATPAPQQLHRQRKQGQQQHQGQQQQQQPLWQQLDSRQARQVVQHAVLLHRKSYVQGRPDAAAATAVQTNRQLLAHVVNKAATGVVAGDAAAAATALRGMWRLGCCSTQQQQQLGQLLLDCMCYGHSAAASGAPADTAAAAEASELADAAPKTAVAAADQQHPVVPIRSLNLLADVAQAVKDLQLQPSREWLWWFRSVSMHQLQQQHTQQHCSEGINQQQHPPRNSTWHVPKQQQQPQQHRLVLVALLQLAHFVAKLQESQQSPQQQLQAKPTQQMGRQQEQHDRQQHVLGFPDSAWLQVWVAAACQLPQPFTAGQLLAVTAAAKRLGMQLPGSFWHSHLPATRGTGMEGHQLLALLVLLPPVIGSNRQQQQVVLPGAWLTAAADQLPTAAVAAAAASRESDASAASKAWRLLPEAVWAAYQLRLPLSQAAAEQILAAFLARPDRIVAAAGVVVGGSSGSSVDLAGTAAGSIASLLQTEATTTTSTGLLHSQPSAAAAGAVSPVASCDNVLLQQLNPESVTLAVYALAQLTKQQPPSQALLLQLQHQLLPLLPNCSMKSLQGFLWAFGVLWRVRPSQQWLSNFCAVTEPLLASCGSEPLKQLGICMAVLKVPVPGSWMVEFVRATAAVLGVVASRGQRQQQREQQEPLVPSAGCSDTGPSAVAAAAAAGLPAPSAAFLANVAYSLVQLGVMPNQRWQLAWQQQVSAQLPRMTPNQLVDVLCAAAVWSKLARDWPLAESVDAALQGAVLSQSPSLAAAGRAVAEANMSSSSSSSSSFQEAAADLHTAGGRNSATAALLPKPHYRPSSNNNSSSSSSSSTASVGLSAEHHSSSSQPYEAWVRPVLHQLRLHMLQCTASQLTTTLWCLRQMQLKASVAWLDALYDALLLQLPECNMLQLQQLLRGLVDQGHVLAPARVDAVLQAALDLLQKDLCCCSEQQLVWLMRLVVLLRHEPEQEWVQQVAAAAQCMLKQRQGAGGQQPQLAELEGSSTVSTQDSPAPGSSSSGGSSSSSTIGSGWHPVLLTDLLDSLAQLGVPLPGSWADSFRHASRHCLLSFSGLQLARLLSAMALLHWQDRAPRPYMQQMLLLLQRRLPSMDAHALGLAGVAVAQLGLLLRRAWVGSYLTRVKQLTGSRLVASDFSNLQRSVQYMRWCVDMQKAGGVRAAAGQQAGNWLGRRQQQHRRLSMLRGSRLRGKGDRAGVRDGGRCRRSLGHCRRRRSSSSSSV